MLGLPAYAYSLHTRIYGYSPAHPQLGVKPAHLGVQAA